MRSTRLNPAFLAAASLVSALALICGLGAGAAHATNLESDLIDQMIGTFAFNFSADLSADQRLDPLTTNEEICPGLEGPDKCNRWREAEQWNLGQLFRRDHGAFDFFDIGNRKECGGSVVPEPAPLLLVGGGLAGLAIAGSCRRRV